MVAFILQLEANFALLKYDKIAIAQTMIFALITLDLKEVLHLRDSRSSHEEKAGTLSGTPVGTAAAEEAAVVLRGVASSPSLEYVRQDP